MVPELDDGSEVLADPHFCLDDLQPGSLWVIKHPFDRSVSMVKRLASIKNGKLWVLGDNPTESSDSRSFGALPAEALVAKVVARLPE